MKYKIQRNTDLFAPLLFTVTDEKGEILYRVERVINNAGNRLEFNICYGNFNTAGSAFGLGGANSWEERRMEVFPVRRCISNLGGFRAEINEKDSLIWRIYTAVNTPLRAEGLLDSVFWLYEGEKEIAKMTRKVFSLGNYKVKIPDDKISRDMVFSVFFGILAIFEQESIDKRHKHV